MLDTLKRIFGFADSHGLRYSVKYLEAIKNKMPFLPVQVQARYADEVCRKNVYDAAYMNQLMEGIDVNDPLEFPNYNTTSIGNLAYISLHGCTPFARKKAEQILVNYKDWAIRTKMGTVNPCILIIHHS